MTWTVLFSLCSTAMLLGNKAVLTLFPFPLALTCVQLFSAALLVLPFVLHSGRKKLSWRELGCYAFEGALFSISIFAGLKSLGLTNIGTVIIARSCLPLVVYAGEYLQGKASGLSLRSCASLICVTCFGTLYALDAKGIRVTASGLIWVTFWILLVAVQMIYGKWLVGAVQITNTERVLYSNSLGLPLLAPLASGELASFCEAVKIGGPNLVIISCFIGVLIGYTSWRLRELISATTFSLVGVINKMLTVCIAVAFYRDEGSWISFVSLIGCLISGLFYEGAGVKPSNSKKNIGLGLADIREGSRAQISEI